MTGRKPRTVVRNENELEEETLSIGKGVRRAVLLDETDGTPNFRMRRYELRPGAEIPKHTNQVEHEVYNTGGEYVAGVGDEEHVVAEGDSLLIPAGTVHWFRNESDEPSEFICVVPNGDTGTKILDDG